MLNTPQAQDQLPPCAPEIQALGQMQTQAAVLGGLRVIASRYGKVGDITQLANPCNAPQDQQIFLVNFEDPADAIAASRRLKCRLFGCSTLLVSVSH